MVPSCGLTNSSCCFFINTDWCLLIWFQSSSSWTSFGSSNGSIPPFTGIPTNLTEPYDWSSVIADMHSGRRPGNNPDGEGNIRVGINPGDHMSEEIYRGLTTAMQLFRDEDASHSNSQPNNSNGN